MPGLPPGAFPALRSTASRGRRRCAPGKPAAPPFDGSPKVAITTASLSRAFRQTCHWHLRLHSRSRRLPSAKRTTGTLFRLARSRFAHPHGIGCVRALSIGARNDFVCTKRAFVTFLAYVVTLVGGLPPTPPQHRATAPLRDVGPSVAATNPASIGSRGGGCEQSP